jgi:hypothetical protein
MKRAAAPLFGLAAYVIGSLAFAGAAAAITPEECILYARAFAAARTAKTLPGTSPALSRQAIQDRAYAACIEGTASPSDTASGEDFLRVPAEPVPPVKAAAVPPPPQPVRAKPIVTVPKATAYAEPENRSAARASRAIAEVAAASPGEQALSVAEVEVCVPGASRTRFWRGLMFTTGGQGC